MTWDHISNTCQVSTCQIHLITATSQPPPHRNHCCHCLWGGICSTSPGAGVPLLHPHPSQLLQWHCHDQLLTGWIPMRQHLGLWAAAHGVGPLCVTRKRGHNCHSLAYLNSYDGPWQYCHEHLLMGWISIPAPTMTCCDHIQLLCLKKAAIVGLCRHRSCYMTGDSGSTHTHWPVCGSKTCRLQVWVWVGYAWKYPQVTHADP